MLGDGNSYAGDPGFWRDTILNCFLIHFCLIFFSFCCFLSCFSLGFSLFYSSFGLFFWGCVWCVGFPSAARNHLCYELWVSHHHASGFSFCFVLLLYTKVRMTPGFLFSPHDTFVFQQDRDSHLNVLQRSRTLGMLPEGLAGIWVVPGTVVLSLLLLQRPEEGSSVLLHFWLQLPLSHFWLPIGIKY